MLLHFHHKLHYYFTWWMLLKALEPWGILQRFAPYTWPTASHCCWLCLLPCSHVQSRPIDILIDVQAEKFGEGRCSVRVHFDTRISSNYIKRKHKITFKVRTNRHDFNVGHWIAIHKPQKAHNHSEFYTKQAEISPCCASLLNQMVLLTSGTTSYRFVIPSSLLLILINAQDSNSKLPVKGYNVVLRVKTLWSGRVVPVFRTNALTQPSGENMTLNNLGALLSYYVHSYTAVQ